MAGYENFYPGGSSNFDSSGYNSVFTGYRIPISELGVTTSIQNIKQAQEVSSRLNEGVKNVEFSMVKKDVFDMIPKEQLDEVRRLHKLTNTEPSFHAPLIDAAGFTEQGWNEENRIIAENQIDDIVKRGQTISTGGNMPIVLHSSASIPGQTKIKEGKEVKQDMLVIIDPETGKFEGTRVAERFYPSGVKQVDGKIRGEKTTPEEELSTINESFWDGKLSEIVVHKERGDRLLERALPIIKSAKSEQELNEAMNTYGSMVNNSRVYHKDARLALNGLFNKAMKSVKDKSDKDSKIIKNELLMASNQFKKELGGAQKELEQSRNSIGYIEQESEAIQNLLSNMQKITDSNGRKKPIPEVYRPIDEFAIEKSSKTFGNVAFNAYKKFKDKAPILAIENPPYGGAISTAKHLKGLVKESRKVFVKRAMNEGYGKSEAKQMAKKLIGATWDTAHIAMMKNRGFTNQDLVKEAEKIAPYVKHVHMNDSLGGSGSDLPSGMGDTPMNAVMKTFEKAGFKGKKVFEGGSWAAQYQSSPNKHVIESLGSPLYEMKAGPYWNEISDTMQGYYAGFGTMLPEQHFSMYGAGWSQLPQELGGRFRGAGADFQELQTLSKSF